MIPVNNALHGSFSLFDLITERKGKEIETSHEKRDIQ